MSEERTRHRKRTKKKKKTSSTRKRARVVNNLIWIAGGLAIGLPLLTVTLYLLAAF